MLECGVTTWCHGLYRGQATNHCMWFVLHWSKTASGRICKVTFFGVGNFASFCMVTNRFQPVQSWQGVIHHLSLASNMSHYQLYSKYVACPPNSLVTSLKKNRKMVFGVESLFTWVASLIFSVHSARRKGGFHQSFKCLLSAHLTSSRLLPSLLQLPIARVSSLSSFSLPDGFAIQYHLLFSIHFHHKNLCHCDKEKLYSLENDTSWLVLPG